jgi:hypothetical protein
MSQRAASISGSPVRRALSWRRAEARSGRSDLVPLDEDAFGDGDLGHGVDLLLPEPGLITVARIARWFAGHELHLRTPALDGGGWFVENRRSVPCQERGNSAR